MVTAGGQKWASLVIRMKGFWDWGNTPLGPEQENSKFNNTGSTAHPVSDYCYWTHSKTYLDDFMRSCLFLDLKH